MIQTGSDVIYAVDTSSVYNQFNMLLDGVQNLTEYINNHNPDVHIGMVTFSNNTSTAFDINEYTTFNSLLSASQLIQQEHDVIPNVTSAIKFTNDVSFRHSNIRNNSRQSLVLFTNSDWGEISAIKAELYTLKKQNIGVFLVVIGDVTDIDSYYELFPASHVVYISESVADIKRLDMIAAQTQFSVCSDTIFTDRT